MAAFTAAEAAGQDGVAAAGKVLAEMDPHGDPTGLFAAGLAKYQQASQKAKAAQAAPTEAERQALLAEANALVAEGNVLLAAHEQNLVRDLYEKEPAHAVVHALTPTMRVHDEAHPDGYELLPGSDANWADYAARMGLAPATAADYVENGHENGVIEVKNPVNGQTEYWRIIQPPKPGTIPGYFADIGAGGKAASIIAATPPAVEMHNVKAYPSMLDLLKDIGGAVADAFEETKEAIGDAAEAVGDAVGDAAEAVGDAIGGVASALNPFD
jgi:hypothetical protein